LKGLDLTARERADVIAAGRRREPVAERVSCRARRICLCPGRHHRHGRRRGAAGRSLRLRRPRGSRLFTACDHRRDEYAQGCTCSRCERQAAGRGHRVR